ncbi:MAG: type II toxin-antitoxin system HicB family antitoxin [Cyanobacteria bacterium J06626_18]
MTHRYSIVINWSEDDQIYVVSLPDFGPYAHTHGSTREDALKNAEEVLELLVESYRHEGKSLPEPSVVAVTAN